MPRLSHERLEELLRLYGESRECPLDEQHVRRQAYWDAVNRAGDDSATSGEEVNDVIRYTWHKANKIKPTSF